VCADLARLFLAEDTSVADGDGIELVVFGARLRGMPLNHELTRHGCRFLAEVRTAETYRLYALETEPAKPGLLRVRRGGRSIEGELWDVPPTVLAELLARLAPPLSLGPVQLADGSQPVGFQCEVSATCDARDITNFGGWRAYSQLACAPAGATDA
jgi:allophanate hydrolase